MNGGPTNEELDLLQASMNDVAQDPEEDYNQEDLEVGSTPRKEVDQSINDQSLDTTDFMAGDSTETLCTRKELLTGRMGMMSTDEGSKNSGSDERKSEDMFLNIAKAEAGGQELVSRSDRRRVSFFPFSQLCCDLCLSKTLLVKNGDILHLVDQPTEQ